MTELNIEKLLSISSAPISRVKIPEEYLAMLCGRGGLVQELSILLRERNGFYAFESALHVFPIVESSSETDRPGLEAWNENGLWKAWYQGHVGGLFFFAEDIFGGQFAIKDEEIVSFEPESGEIKGMAKSVEGWAEAILSNYRELTGSPIAHDWQAVHGTLTFGCRLLPKIPFILGGSYSENNLFAVDAVKGMRYRGELWEQLRDLPDGAQVRLRALPLQ
jgi:hypothetical protein